MSTPHAHEVRTRTERFIGSIFSVFTDEVSMPGDRVATRDHVLHVGAVAVAAIDPGGRVVLVRQYRHPVGRRMWELPAGLMDVSGEDLAAAAARELAEEADLVAGRLDLLVDVHTSPGFTNEVVRVFLARDLTEVPQQQRHVREDEEADMEIAWFDLDDAVDMALAGQITNGPAVAGLLAAARAR
ncbi:MAG TPA: NUDIX hydrolase, partial [Actinoplanes sp.]|nr:NUDIX hydrolase [Actinoplanes sp.]